jgi:F420-dependent oxidoreductase-like protein
MIEGQQGLSWPRWQRLVRAAEELGFDGLYRSDHFSDPEGQYRDALESWVSFTWLAGNTDRIAFGPMVSPVSFRNPVMTAWQASGVDALACGRLRLGLGAGWQEREHNSFGFDLLDVPERFARFEEGLEVISRLLQADGPVSWEGAYYRIQDAMLCPRSPRDTGPPILIGGNGPKRTLPLVAKFADEWNAVMATPERFAELNQQLDVLLAERNRLPEDVKRTLMTRAVVGADDAAVKTRLDGADGQALRDRGAVIGTPAEAIERIGAYADVGAQGVMLQWMDMDDISGLEFLAAEVLPHVR